MSTPDLLTVRQAAKLLGRGVHFIYRLVRDRKLGHYQDGPRGLRIPREELDRYVRQHTTPAKREFFRHPNSSNPGTRYTQAKEITIKDIPGFSRI